MNAYLILENGTILQGKQFGSTRKAVCEIVFNTSMTGYLELLTDPSYAGQGIVMTYPIIGNYGIFEADAEALRPWAEAFIIRENNRIASNFRNEKSLSEYLVENDVPGIQGIDTRALTKILRENGTMIGMVTSGEMPDIDEAIREIKAFRYVDLVEKVSCKQKSESFGIGARIAMVDYGAKRSMISAFLKRKCTTAVFPAEITARELLEWRPDGIVLGNGPGDPKDCRNIIEEIKVLYDAGVPMLGICLGHQLTALAAGFDTHKLKYGHRGANHPVKNLVTGRTYITSQNHGYVVTRETIDPAKADVLFENVNDKTVEGISYHNKNIITVQYHPEASPGPKDSDYLFDDFLQLAGGGSL